jgi:hypothetical protein
VFRSIYSARNAEYQIAAAAAGVIGPLSPGEVREAAGIHAKTTGQARAWESWAVRLGKTGGLPKSRAPARPAARSKSAAKPTAKTPRR